MKPNKKPKKKKPECEIPSDVLGSYTGRPKDKNDKPTQDADDL